MKVKGKTAAVKYKKVKKKAQTLKAAKVTVKRGLKKGTYKVKVKVTASGNAKYKKAAKAVLFRVKIK